LTIENLFLPQYPLSDSDLLFGEYYIAARQKENRIYSDEQVKRLPDIENSNIHSAEWKLRKQSSERLIRYLKNKHLPMQILEVGCGNGWLSHKLAQIEKSVVTGIDINKIEINQAKIVFQEKSNLFFISNNIESISHAVKYDVVVFAASLQYFFSLKETIGDVLLRLKKNGEIHILDTHFYSPADSEKARNRSQIYYRSIGLKEMADYYFHHSSQSLNKFCFSYLYNPKDIKNKILGSNNPFPWIRILQS
jgi:ubiquinone/menaquinone biosynthesis C-methylase UbiE